MKRTVQHKLAASRLGLAVVFGIGLILCFACVDAFARVGGGESFGGGGSSSPGDSGNGDLLVWLVYLAIRHPALGVPLLVIVGVVWVTKRRHDDKYRLPASTQQSLNALRTGEKRQKRSAVLAQLEKLKENDPNFSEVLFLDFAQMIYARYQLARGDKYTQGLVPYLSPELHQQLTASVGQYAKGEFSVFDVVVGSIDIHSVIESKQAYTIVCEVTANYTEVFNRDADSMQQAYYVRSSLSFRRNKGVLSKGPESITSLGCPSCGSPMKLDAENVCAYCSQPIRPGLFHWELEKHEEALRLERKQMPLDISGQEVGTDFPTFFDPNLDVETRAYLMRYPDQTLQSLYTRVREIFLALQKAWSSGTWETARAFETDRLFQTHQFWMEAYRQKEWHNLIEQVQVKDVVLTKLARDAYFEIATFRIRASMLDYVLDRSDNLVAGSRDQVRLFSEYWTFIRRAGYETPAASNTSSCPNCGAPLKIAMSGRCEYCDTNISTGEFDWTLAKIEQDESYAG